MIARDAMLALDTQARLHIQHLSAGRNCRRSSFCAKMGAKVGAEVTPQLVFTDRQSAVSRDWYKCQLNPPASDKGNVAKILEGLKT